MDLLKEITTFISTVGFPIAVAAYVLVRVEQTLGKLSESIAELSATLRIVPCIRSKE